MLCGDATLAQADKSTAPVVEGLDSDFRRVLDAILNKRQSTLVSVLASAKRPTIGKLANLIYVLAFASLCQQTDADVEMRRLREGNRLLRIERAVF